ncbi:MAG: hypothetical protein HYU41_01700 [Candidatus Rokubacteria bacterium]|nr:hypothetical protein [Candidatus Rokubacteria bacterium]
MPRFTYADVAVHVFAQQRTPGWTFVVDIRDGAGTLLKTLRSDEVVYLSSRLAEEAAAAAAREWIDDIWLWRQRLGPRPPG